MHIQKDHTVSNCDFTYMHLCTLVHTKGQYPMNMRLHVPVHTKRPYLAYLQNLIPGQYRKNVHLSVPVFILPRGPKLKLFVFCFQAVPATREMTDGPRNERTDEHLNFHIMWDNVGCGIMWDVRAITKIRPSAKYLARLYPAT